MLVKVRLHCGTCGGRIAGMSSVTRQVTRVSRVMELGEWKVLQSRSIERQNKLQSRVERWGVGIKVRMRDEKGLGGIQGR